MNKNDKVIDAYEIHFREMMNSNVAGYRGNKQNKDNEVFEKNTFNNNKKDHFNPSK